MTNDPFDLDLFFGELTGTRTLVYARCIPAGNREGLTLVGEIRGPFCRHAATLPLRVPLVDCGPGETILAKATLTEACFWSPDLPAIYEAHISLLRGQEVIATAQRQIGLRWLGCREGSFVWQGKRWVLRGVSAGSSEENAPRQWQEAAACLVTREPADEQLAEASRDGALTVVDWSAHENVTGAQLRHIAGFPAVAVVVLAEGSLADESALRAVPNLILAQSLVPGHHHAVMPWAKVFWACAQNPQALAQFAATADLPIVAVRTLQSPVPLGDARSACDNLQRDLAPLGQFAGYVV